jgi:hypothetical protein
MTHHPHPIWAALTVLAALAATPALAAGPADTGHANAKQRYQRESAACMRIKSPDDRANCLSEASTRLAATQPTPPSEVADALRRNALKRCEPLPPDLRADCQARMQGAGTVTGSVESGGIYRELVTRVTEPAPAAEPATTTN